MMGGRFLIAQRSALLGGKGHDSFIDGRAPGVYGA